jgi:threonylcarbamoyladenosine tRNA methylthiotransferase MtaB
MKFSILTLGCRVNQSESDVIEGNLVGRGHSVVPLCEKPDYCIVNTCSVTAKSDHQSRQLARRALRQNARVIVTGCYAQLRPEDFKRISSDMLIVTNNNKYNIINILDNNIKYISLSYSNRSRPSIKVQDGCNHTCSFCIVPYARGKSRSVESHTIVDQIFSLESKGFNEIVLTGIHLGSYGNDLKPQLKLSDIIEIIINKTQIKRIRLSSLGMNAIDSSLIDLLQENRVCKHLHIPLQSGDDSVLRRMRRPYDSASYFQIISRIIAKIPNISIGTDVIVGFPGETDSAFINTKNLIEDVPFAYLHIFPYSVRSGTAASKMAGQIEFSIKKRRYEILRQLNSRKKELYISSQINKILDIVIEDEDSDQGMVGTSSNYLKIRVCAKRYPKKSLIAVRVAERTGDTLRGVPVEKL